VCFNYSFSRYSHCFDSLRDLPEPTHTTAARLTLFFLCYGDRTLFATCAFIVMVLPLPLRVVRRILMPHFIPPLSLSLTRMANIFLWHLAMKRHIFDSITMSKAQLSCVAYGDLVYGPWDSAQTTSLSQPLGWMVKSQDILEVS
jgi:hypothetical protein